jgi:hypothetical protein
VRGILVVLVACGGAPPAQTDRAPTCMVAAARFVRLLDGGGFRRPAYRRMLADCTATPWSPDRRACTVRARDVEDLLGCPD